MKYIVDMTDEYEEWFNQQTAKSMVQIVKRIRKIEEEGYFGNHKEVAENIFELKWKNGRRVYYTIIPISQVLLLLGGNKNGQDKDIKEAEKIYHEWTTG